VGVEIADLSVGGVRLTAPIRLNPGIRATVHVELDAHLSREFGDREVAFDVEIKTSELGPHHRWEMRCVNDAPAGSHSERLISHLVVAAQRRELALKSGAGDGSPMASDSERRASHRRELGTRYGKSSLYPHLDD
jgi:hypothetical protein